VLFIAFHVHTHRPLLPDRAVCHVTATKCQSCPIPADVIGSIGRTGASDIAFVS
jgi:hypothetical protein